MTTCMPCGTHTLVLPPDEMETLVVELPTRSALPHCVSHIEVAAPCSRVQVPTAYSARVASWLPLSETVRVAPLYATARLVARDDGPCRLSPRFCDPPAATAVRRAE